MPAAGVIVHFKHNGRGVIFSDLLGSGGVAVSGAGTWTQIVGFSPFSVDITATNATVQLRGHNGVLTSGSNVAGQYPQFTAPTNATDGFQIGANVVNQRAAIVFASPVTYVKAKVTSRTGGTITARLLGRENGA